MANNVSSWLLACKGWRQEGDTLLASMEGLSSQWDVVSDSDAHIIKPTVDTLKQQQVALRNVLKTGQGTTEELDTYLTQFKAGTVSPPIEKYLDLKNLSELEEFGKAQHARCNSHDEVATAKRAIQPHKAAMADLISACKSAISDVKRAMKGLTRLSSLSSKLKQEVGSAEAPRARRSLHCLNW